MSFSDVVFDHLIRPARIRGKFRLFSKLLPHSGQRCAVVHGYRMQLDLADLVQKSVFLGSYEFNETKWVREILRSGDVAIDVGANCGYYTALFWSIIGANGKVICLEPNPSLADGLKIFLENNQLQGTLIRAGASDEEGEISLYRPPAAWQNEDATMAKVEGWESIQVPIVKLDNLFDGFGAKYVRLVKLDIEGHEFRALRGMEQNLRAGRVDFLLTELNDYWLRQHGTSPEALIGYCRDLGFGKIRRGGMPGGNGISSILLEWTGVPPS